MPTLIDSEVEWASWVELASCQFPAYCRAGRMPTLLDSEVEWASWVELASCQFHGYLRAGRMPTLLLFKRRFSNAVNFSLTPIPDSRFPIPDSR
ncbi:hypothetical protein [Moorena producens]|uniref:hypothetical protein n=1 Tax=Moorena producens TaxID=1155739 RepID=UPI003C737752